ncbi:unnamed protein product, partial [Polarella glacialis]
VRHFAKLHGRQAISGESKGDSSPRRLGRQGHEKPSAVSAELAMDKLADALVQVAQATAAAGGGFFGSRQRGRATSTAAPSGAPPWWRQAPGCCPSVLIGSSSWAAEEEGPIPRRSSAAPQSYDDSDAEPLSGASEALRTACGLWRLGASCQLWPQEAGPLETRSVLETFQQLGQYGAEGVLGPVLPDFILTVR